MNEKKLFDADIVTTPSLREVARGHSDKERNSLRVIAKGEKPKHIDKPPNNEKRIRDKARGILSSDEVSLRKKVLSRPNNDYKHLAVAEMHSTNGPVQGSAQHLMHQKSREPSLQNVTSKVDPVVAFIKEFRKEFEIAVVGGTLYLYNGAFYELLPDKKAMSLILRRFEKTPGISNMLERIVKIMKIYTEVEYDEFPINPNLIVFKNGTLELDSMKFRRSMSDDLASSALSVEYNENQSEMPHIVHFFKTVSGRNPNIVERMLQTIGYIITNDISAKSFFYLQGVGDSGKSLFCALVSYLFPKSGANAVGRVALQDFGGRFALASLVNARLNISEDLPDTILTPTTVSRVKMLSDFNRVECEQKYLPAFSYRFLCKLLFASNHPLRLKEYDQAFVNRIVYIPFDNAIPKEKQDRSLLKKMIPELSALVNYALEAYRQLVENGYDWAGNFEPEIIIPKSPTKPDKILVLQRFLSHCCIFDSDAITSSEDLRFAYSIFCSENSYQAIIGDRFSRELLAVLPATVDRVKIGNKKRGYRGVKLKQSYD